jgi:hypothetical protein
MASPAGFETDEAACFQLAPNRLSRAHPDPLLPRLDPWRDAYALNAVCPICLAMNRRLNLP